RIFTWPSCTRRHHSIPALTRPRYPRPTPPIRAHFFFSCSDDPRDLHSFPTRRSSDLTAADGAHNPVDNLHQVTVVAKLDVALLEDRKSTRLNSSHLGISYAVFCLKKKKNTIDHKDEI